MPESRPEDALGMYTCKTSELCKLYLSFKQVQPDNTMVKYRHLDITVAKMMENLFLKLFLFSSRFSRSSINLALMLRTSDTWDTQPCYRNI